MTVERRSLDLLPCLIKASAVQLAETSQHRLGVVPAPTSSRATHAEMGDVLAPAFHSATPNRVPLSSKLQAVHARQHERPSYPQAALRIAVFGQDTSREACPLVKPALSRGPVSLRQFGSDGDRSLCDIQLEFPPLG